MQQQFQKNILHLCKHHFNMKIKKTDQQQNKTSYLLKTFCLKVNFLYESTFQ